MNVAQNLGEVEVLDTEGRAVVLGSYWAERPAAVVFVRHYG